MASSPRPVCSLIIVNWNGAAHVRACLDSVLRQDYPAHLLDVCVVDNGSTDGSREAVARDYPAVRVLTTDENNYARALNTGVRVAKGERVAFLNNDVVLDPRWLPALVDALEARPDAGGAGGKIRLANGRINSAGIDRLPHFFWRDTGFDEPDRGQYDEPREVEALCWAAVLFRRECLERVGEVDEDFVMYVEDVDYATRCRDHGFRLLYRPEAVVAHAYRGSSRGSALTEYFVNRNRFLYLAKHYPEALPDAVRTSHFLLRRELPLLWECMPMTVQKLLAHHPPATAEPVLAALGRELGALFGPLAVDRLFMRLEVALGRRPLRVGIYDHVLHVIGGGQKYAADLASVLQDEMDVTLVVNKPVAPGDLEARYNVALPRCRVQVVPLPFYERQGREWVDPALVAPDADNPFDAVADASRAFDVFVNANMLEKVQPRAPLSIFVCHFPDARRSPHFAVDDYTLVVNNSEYGREWTRRLWGIDPALVLHPAVEMEAPAVAKEPVILSVARFEPGGSKKQRELIRAFERLLAEGPDDLRDWRLVLAGGSLEDNAYLEEIRQAADASAGRVTVRVNASFAEVQALYARASLFWHACGLDETDPRRIEHFGMTTVEAMQNRCVPVVYDGGGQREIVEHGRSGFLFATLEELGATTLALVRDPGLRRTVAEGAHARGQAFRRSAFATTVRTVFDLIRGEYATIRRPDPGEILARTAGGRTERS